MFHLFMSLVLDSDLMIYTYLYNKITQHLSSPFNNIEHSQLLSTQSSMNLCLSPPSSFYSNTSMATASRGSRGSSDDSTATSGDIHLLIANKDEEWCKKPTQVPKKRRYFTIPFSSSFFHRRDKMSSSRAQSGKTAMTAREVFKRCVKKMRPFYAKISIKQESSNTYVQCPTSSTLASKNGDSSSMLHRLSFSGNQNYTMCSPQSRSNGMSCPSSMNSSPNRPAGLHRTSMEELQSAIQGAIAHCKSSSMAKSSWSRCS